MFPLKAEWEKREQTMAEEITGSSTINEILRSHPDSLPIFYRFNVDVCCGASQSIEDTARQKGFQAGDLIAALKQSLGATAQ
ncbi:MAG: hypothetical protein PHX83_05055 [Acidobacteriia bacterium]|nr:hypothetical protein [Terriglobia bacterium]